MTPNHYFHSMYNIIFLQCCYSRRKYSNRYMFKFKRQPFDSITTKIIVHNMTRNTVTRLQHGDYNQTSNIATQQKRLNTTATRLFTSFIMTRQSRCSRGQKSCMFDPCFNHECRSLHLRVNEFVMGVVNRILCGQMLSIVCIYVLYFKKMK